MFINLIEKELRIAITDYVRKMGVTIQLADISFKAGRGDNGLTTTINISPDQTEVPMGTPPEVVADGFVDWAKTAENLEQEAPVAAIEEVQEPLTTEEEDTALSHFMSEPETAEITSEIVTPVEVEQVKPAIFAGLSSLEGEQAPTPPIKKDKIFG